MLSDTKLFQRRDWLSRGIIANLPGLGKTIIAIVFALIYRKLKDANKPVLFIVKASISAQYCKEVFRFVDAICGDLLNGGLHLLDLSGSEHESKRVPRAFQAKYRIWILTFLL